MSPDTQHYRMVVVMVAWLVLFVALAALYVVIGP